MVGRFIDALVHPDTLNNDTCIDTLDGVNASIQIRLFVFVTSFNLVYKVTFSERDFDWMTLD